LQTEEYQKNPDIVMQKVVDFLEIGSLLPLEKVDSKRMNEGKIKVGHMLDKTRRLLDDFYLPYNKMLADILFDKKFVWSEFLSFDTKPTKTKNATFGIICTSDNNFAKSVPSVNPHGHGKTALLSSFSLFWYFSVLVILCQFSIIFKYMYKNCSQLRFRNRIEIK